MAGIGNFTASGVPSTPPRRNGPDDIALWPDGCWASLDEVWNGEFDWRSDDYEVIAYDDVERLKATGILDELE